MQQRVRKTETKPMFPLLMPMATTAVEEGEISCVSGDRLAFTDVSFDLSEFATVRLSDCKFKNCSFYRTSLVKVLIESCSFVGCRFEGGYWQNVFAEDSKFTGCDFSESVFKDTVFRRCLLQYANLNGSELRQVVWDEIRLTDSELSECKVQGLQLHATDLTGTNCFKTYFSGTDLTDTEIGGITLSKDFAELRGALITPYQAGELVKLLGIKVQF